MVDCSYTVTLWPSGHRFQCGADKSVLSAGLAAGIFLPYSCRSGVCNTCRGRIVDGEVDFGQVSAAHLTEADKSAGLAMLCQARPKTDLVVEVRELEATEAIRSRTLPARVLTAERIASDVMVVTLGLPANEPVFLRAGQYLEVQMAGDVRRTYSIANVAGPEGVRQLELHIRHLPGGLFTDRLFSAVKPREIWKVEVPLGTFYLREHSDKPIVMLASGTGFAPIKALVEHGIQRGDRRPIDLYWGGRRRADLYMADLAERWASEHEHLRFIPVLSDARPQCAWTGRSGFVHRAVLEDFGDLSGHQVYACGAPLMVDSAKADFIGHRALPPEEFFADSFITAADRPLAAA